LVRGEVQAGWKELRRVDEERREEGT